MNEADKEHRGRHGWSAVLDVVRDIQARFHLESLLPQLRATSRLAGESRIVNVAVVGRFKAGKSSFLNQIIGRDLLPVDVLPATAVITQLHYGPTERATVIYRGGRKEDILLERLAEFVTEKENPENAKEVALVDIESPALEPFRTVRFVDTPGLGSIYTRTTRTCVDWLPEIGAAIVALTLDPPLSGDDLNLIRDLTRFTPEIVILLTKADLATPEQVDKVKSFVREELHKRLDIQPPIFPYSTRGEYRNLQEELRNYLIDRMATRHEERLQEILAHKVRTLVRECLGYLALAEAAAQVTEQARAELASLVEQEQNHLGQIHTEVRLLAADLKRRVHDSLTEGYDALYPQVLTKVRADFDREAKEWRGNLAKTSEQFQKWAGRSLSSRLGEALPLGEKFLSSQLAEAEAHFGRIVRAFQDRLSLAVEKALGARFQGATFSAEVDPPQFPDIHVDKTFDIPLDMLWFLVPMPLFRPLIYRRLRSQIPWEVEKNLTRLVWQWTEAAGRSLEQMARQAEEFMQQEAVTVVKLASASGDRLTEIREAMELLMLTSQRSDV